MNKTDAKKIAEKITNEQLAEMLNNARRLIKDWRQISNVNKSMTKGAAWNILAQNFDVSRKYNSIVVKNMVWEFGEYLPEELKPVKVVKNKYAGIVNHQEPIFRDELPEVGEYTYYAGSFYKVAEIKEFPHGIMIGIYDQNDNEHIDYVKAESVKKAIPCYACHGGGCPVCSGIGKLIQDNC